MNSDQMRGVWKQFKGKVEEKWGEAIKNKIYIAAGRREQLVGIILEESRISEQLARQKADQYLKFIAF